MEGRVCSSRVGGWFESSIDLLVEGFVVWFGSSGPCSLPRFSNFGTKKCFRLEPTRRGPNKPRTGNRGRSRSGRPIFESPRVWSVVTSPAQPGTWESRLVVRRLGSLWPAPRLASPRGPIDPGFFCTADLDLKQRSGSVLTRSRPGGITRFFA